LKKRIPGSILSLSRCQVIEIDCDLGAVSNEESDDLKVAKTVAKIGDVNWTAIGEEVFGTELLAVAAHGQLTALIVFVYLFVLAAERLVLVILNAMDSILGRADGVETKVRGMEKVTFCVLRCDD
jgi:hypothetical protein